MSTGVARSFIDVDPDAAEDLRSRLDECPLLVIGGRQREPRSLLETSGSWYGYDLGVMLRVDGSGVTTMLEYSSRPDAHGPDDAVLFKSATRQGDRLYCCTQTEVIVYSLPDMAEVAYISLPIFNDVHHVVPTPQGTLLVAVSGLELVVELTLGGEIVHEWNVLGESTWANRPAGVDYRCGVDLKPHRAHPNHLFFIGDEPFVTRFELRDAMSLQSARRIDIGGERVHDGDVVDGSVYFTTVDSGVVRADAESLRIVERHQLARRRQRSDDDVLGWCRALYFDDDHCWVGFSRIRPTRLRQTVAWIRSGGADQAPTRIARYRRSDWVCDAEIDLEPFGLNAVFSVVPA